MDLQERAVVSLRFGLDEGEPRTLEEVASRLPRLSRDVAP